MQIHSCLLKSLLRVGGVAFRNGRYMLQTINCSGKKKRTVKPLIQVLKANYNILPTDKIQVQSQGVDWRTNNGKTIKTTLHHELKNKAKSLKP